MRDVTWEYTNWQGQKKSMKIEKLIKCSDGIYRPESIVTKNLDGRYDKFGKPIENTKINVWLLVDKSI